MDDNERRALHARILEESRKFREKLPELLKTELAGKWVVFRDGEVVSAHDDEEEGYTAALTRFGVHGGFVLARVAPPEVLWLRPG